MIGSDSDVLVGTLEADFGPKLPGVSCPSEKYALGEAEIPALPGHGSPGLDCGLPKTYVCLDCGHHFHVERSCMQRECPACWKKWASKESKVASWRFWTGSKYVAYQKMIPKREARKVHVVISFPSEGTLSSQRKLAIQHAKDHGLLGGLLVYHPFRQDEADAWVEDGHVHFHVLALADGDILTDIGVGIEKASEHLPDVPDLNELSCERTLGRIFDEVDSHVFKHVKHPDGHFRGFQSVDEVRACTFYLLTHAGIIEGRHALTWWGALSYNMLPIRILDANYEGRELYCRSLGHACPECGSLRTEIFENDQDLGFRSREPIQHGYFPRKSTEWEYFMGRSRGS